MSFIYNIQEKKIVKYINCVNTAQMSLFIFEIKVYS